MSTTFEQAIAGQLPASFAAAARFERDRRNDTYPKLVRDRKITLHAATIDYQAWVAITTWLESGTFRSIEGGHDGKTVVSWPECAVAADKALASVDRMIARRKDPDSGASDAERAETPELQRRRANLFCIAEVVRRVGDAIAAINAELKAPTAPMVEEKAA